MRILGSVLAPAVLAKALLLPHLLNHLGCLRALCFAALMVLPSALQQCALKVLLPHHVCSVVAPREKQLLHNYLGTFSGVLVPETRLFVGVRQARKQVVSRVGAHSRLIAQNSARKVATGGQLRAVRTW